MGTPEDSKAYRRKNKIKNNEGALPEYCKCAKVDGACYCKTCLGACFCEECEKGTSYRILPTIRFKINKIDKFEKQPFLRNSIRKLSMRQKIDHSIQEFDSRRQSCQPDKIIDKLNLSSKLSKRRRKSSLDNYGDSLSLSTNIKQFDKSQSHKFEVITQEKRNQDQSLIDIIEAQSVSCSEDEYQ